MRKTVLTETTFSDNSVIKATITEVKNDEKEGDIVGFKIIYGPLQVIAINDLNTMKRFFEVMESAKEYIASKANYIK